MRVLVVYATRYGATQGIAERIAETLNGSGHQAAAVPARSAGVLDGYDAYVVGSAVYMGSWLKEATDFVLRNKAVLAGRPVWLFSSGPIGTRTVDDQGRDVRESAVPKEIAEFETAIHPRDHRVFFGAIDHAKFGLGHRMLLVMPAMRKLLVDGDYRDWPEIEGYARSIATSLTPAGVI